MILCWGEIRQTNGFIEISIEAGILLCVDGDIMYDIMYDIIYAMNAIYL
jgi:hypothetical protein